METRVRIANHPVHPMLVPLPIGLFIFTLIADAAYRLGWSPVWDAVAFYALAVGIIGALLAAVAGLIDFTGLRRSRAREIATVHMALNVTIVVLQVVNLWLRARTAPGAGLPFALSIISVGLLAVSGWLGWDLVYRHGIGLDRRITIEVEERRQSGRGAA
jgi:uncharacterized membrane protein